MGGDATFSGTTYQARVIALVYVHILAQMRLGWLGPVDDTPLAVSGETAGPGDDARIEFGERHAAVEIQAKHGLTAGAKLREAIEHVRSGTADGDSMPVILVVDRGSSKKVYTEFAADVERIRTGRMTPLKPETTRLLNELGDDLDLLKRLFVLPADLDRPQDPESKVALQLLASVLEEPERATAAWAVLVTDAGDICARKLRRTRKEIVDILAGAGIQVRPPAKDERWHRQLDFSKQLLERRHTAAALTVLSRMEAELSRAQAGASVHYRLAQQQAAALLQSDRYLEALASARRALEVDANGIHALVTGASAAALAGDMPMARSLAERAVEAHPQDPSAWGAKAQVASTAGDPLPDPGQAVASSAHYRLVLAQISSADGDWTRVADLTGGLLAEGVRSPDVLFLRANALLEVGGDEDSIVAQEHRENAERLATELIDALGDDTHLLTHKGLVLRSVARRLLGRVADADADLDRARQLATDDPDAIGHMARARIEAGDEDAAIEVLRHPMVDAVPTLLVLRAQLSAARDDDDAATRDVELALRRAADAPDPDLVRLMACHVALILKDTELAARALGGVSESAQMDARYSALLGRMALANGDVQGGTAHYRDAVQRAGAAQVDILAEMGSQLLIAGEAKAAVQAFDEAGAQALPAEVLRHYTAALMQVNELERAQAVIDRLAEQGPMPTWALAAATDIAVRQEDADAAISHLTSLVEREQERSHLRIELVRHLIESGRSDNALPHLNVLAGCSDLTPIEVMQTAQLLGAIGRDEQALALALRAFRADPADPRIHRAFIMLALGTDLAPATVLEVGPDTHVRLRRQDGSTREHTVFADLPIDPIRGEMSVADAAAAGILGKKVGEVVVRNEGTWQEQRWTVEHIVPAGLHAVQDAMLHYEERFPGEPFFMSGFSIGDGTSVKDLAPLIASLEARRAHVALVFEQYRRQILPLGFVAKMAGVSIPEAMEAARAEPESLGPIFVEWSDRAGQDESRAAATEAQEVVVTSSALKTVYDLQLFDTLVAHYRLVAPQSLRDTLREEAREAERLVREGQKTMVSGERGLGVHELEPGHSSLVQELDRARTVLGWLEQQMRLEARPLATIHPAESKEEEMRNNIGRDSFDAVTLTQHMGATMYADDLGLRRFLPKGSRGRSFSTVGLLPALADRGALSAAERDRLLLTLAVRHYTAIPPTRELLESAV